MIKRYIDMVVIYREERLATMDLLYERLKQGRDVSDLPNLAGFSAGKSFCNDKLWFGVETVSHRLLQRMQKSHHISQTEVKRILTEFEGAGISCIVSMIFGFPGERLMEYRNSFRFLKDLRTELEWITFFLNRFRLLAGSAIYENPRKYGIKIKPKNAENDLQTVFPYQERRFPKFRNFDRDYRRFHEKDLIPRQLPKENRHFNYFVRSMLDQTLHGFLYKTRYRKNPFINF